MPENFIKDKYNKTAATYRLREESVYQFSNHLRQAKRYLKNNRVDLVIDIGCGSGAVTRTLAKEFPQTRFLAYDFSENELAIAKGLNMNANAEFNCFDFSEAVPGQLDTLDLGGKTVMVMVLGTLEYYDQNDKISGVIYDLWQKIEKGFFVNILLNQDMAGRSLFLGKGKKYWEADKAVKYFSRPSDKVIIRYYSLLLFDTLITRFGWLDPLFLFFDRLIAALPDSLAKRLATTFELIILRQSDY